MRHVGGWRIAGQASPVRHSTLPRRYGCGSRAWRGRFRCLKSGGLRARNGRICQDRRWGVVGWRWGGIGHMRRHREAQRAEAIQGPASGGPSPCFYVVCLAPVSGPKYRLRHNLQRSRSSYNVKNPCTFCASIHVKNNAVLHCSAIFCDFNNEIEQRVYTKIPTMDK